MKMGLHIRQQLKRIHTVLAGGTLIFWGISFEKTSQEMLFNSA